MKFKPRRRSFVFFALVLVAVVFYTIHVLSSIDFDESPHSVDYKSEVERLRNQIQFLEKKASENENNYKNLEKIYKQLDEAKRREAQHNSNNGGGGGGGGQSENREVIQAPPDIVPGNKPDKRPPPTSSANKFFTKLFIDREEKAYAQQCDWFQEHKPSSSDITVSGYLL